MLLGLLPPTPCADARARALLEHAGAQQATPRPNLPHQTGGQAAIGCGEAVPLRMQKPLFDPIFLSSAP